ncbi:VOC family protein [Cupriavidus sp. 30B13]|uniref:VOC family protein n=1 Tax=Cupriavidus sp. 30B13 TaxID=3384241 RepID=UPI003B915DC9
MSRHPISHPISHPIGHQISDRNTDEIADEIANEITGEIANEAAVCKALTVNHIAISVSDLQRSRQWYCRMFGLRVIQESEQSVLLGFGDSMLVLRPDPRPGTISHFMFGIDRFDAASLAARLRAQGLDPQADSDSFHVRDPDGLNVQVGDKGLGLSEGIVENGFRMR